MNSAVKLLLLMVCLTVARPQTQPPAAPAPQSSNKMETIAPLVKQQFGSSFTVNASMATSLLVADFDGDGVEDVAIVADSKDPLPDSYAFKYSVSDPYNAFFGMTDPRIARSFGRADPGHSHDILVIFGQGADAWRTAAPKAKFAIIDVPFDSVELSRMLVKKNKPPIFTIKVQEAELMDSTIYWDAKKKRWKWSPGDTVQ